MKTKNSLKSLLLLVILITTFKTAFGQLSSIEGEKNPDGSIKKWHRIELVFNGPNLNEAPATFRNYRLDVTFTSPTNKVYKVPGFFDGDIDPANSGASSGNKWKARFAAGEEGTWSYTVSFVTGTDVAANLTGGATGTQPDGQSGTFKVGAQDKSDKDFRAKGKLEYTGQHYLQFANGDNFIKCGANSPEVLMADIDFDGKTTVTNSTGNVNHSSQASSWTTGDPTWKNGKGKGIIGVVNYLSNKGVNSHYFLSMNIIGDGKHTFPYVDYNSPYTFDVSKLGQWELVFSQFDKKGLMIHFQTSETENTQYFENLEGGVGATQFSIARKIYYRELVARFGHHMAITWNVGEENNAAFPGSSQLANTESQRKQFADRLSALTAYNDNITIHNGGSGQGTAVDLYENKGLLGNTNYTGTSLQLNFANDNHANIKYWRDKSAAAGKKWVIAYDETFANSTTDLTILRKGSIWSTLLAGGQMEWYYGGGDLNSNLDYNTLAPQWTTIGLAANFMNTYLSKDIHKMSPNDALINNGNYAMAEAGKTYLFYLKNGGNATVNLSAGAGSSFTVQWFNPSLGGALISSANVNGGSASTNLGNPPNNTTSDWVLLVRNINTGCTASISAPVTTICPGTTALLTASTGASYKWFNGTTQVGTANTYTATTAGSYTVEVTNTANCKATSTPVNIVAQATCGGNLPPVVSFNLPTSGANYTAPATIIANASASDPDGSIVSVDLYLNNIFVRQEKVSPYDWNHINQDPSLANLPNGSYTLKVIATDNLGATASTERIFTVGTIVDPNTPQIAFTLPLNNANTGKNIIVNVANTNTAIAISNVVLYLDGALVRQENTSPYVWNSTSGGSLDPVLSNLSLGTHQLKAEATSSTGVKGQATISINVTSVARFGIIDNNVESSEFVSSYPNPFKDKLTIEAGKNNQIYSVKVSGMDGALYTIPMNIEGNIVELSTESLANGLYIVELSSYNGIITQKIVKQ